MHGQQNIKFWLCSRRHLRHRHYHLHLWPEPRYLLASSSTVQCDWTRVRVSNPHRSRALVHFLLSFCSLSSNFLLPFTWTFISRFRISIPSIRWTRPTIRSRFFLIYEMVLGSSMESYNSLVYLWKLCQKRVKCSFVRALRLCTGHTAHRGSRGILYPFFTTALKGNEWSASRPGRF